MICKWPMVRLAEALDPFERYITSPEARIYPKLSVKLYGKGVVLDTPANGSTLRMKRHQLASAGQVVLSEIWGKKGAIGFVPPEGDGALCTSHFFLFDVLRDRAEPAYLDLIFRSNYLSEQLGAEAKGTTGYAAVRPKHLLSCKIPLPPIGEQQRIVARIDELAAEISEARVYREEAMEQSRVIWQRSASRIFERAEKSFGLLTLAECISIRGGGTPSKSNPFYWSGIIPWVTPKDMKVREVSDSRDHISEQATLETSAKLIEPGAVLIVVRGMILAHTVPTAVLRTRAAINQDMKALIPSSNLLPEYLSAYFWGANDRIVSLVEKSTHDTRKLETPVLMAVKIPVPPLPRQRGILAELDALTSSVASIARLQTETAAELDALLPSILDRAFNGEL